MAANATKSVSHAHQGTARALVDLSQPVAAARAALGDARDPLVLTDLRTRGGARSRNRLLEGMVGAVIHQCAVPEVRCRSEEWPGVIWRCTRPS